jgi:ankyrin repeat protein
MSVRISAISFLGGWIMKGGFGQSRKDTVTMRVSVLLCLVVGNLTCFSFAEAAESEPILPSIQDLAKLSDSDLGLAYLTAQQEEQKFHYLMEFDRFSGKVRRFLLEARDEIQKRGSTRIEAIYDGVVSSACPRDNFASGFARITQDGAELMISHDLDLLPGVVVKDTVLVVIPPKQELLVGKIYEDGFTLVARSGNCSMSFARAINLHDAVRAGDIAVVQSVIESGADVNEPDSWGTPLDIAVSKGANKIVQLLIDAGADVEGATSPGAGGEHPLHLAATRTSGASTARLLISRGAQLDARDKAGRTPLIAAVLADNVEVADVLLAAGADLEAVDSNLGASPLSWAACWERFKAAKFLLAKGAQINRRAGPDGDTPLHRAVMCCKVPNMIKYLVANGADVDAANNKGLTPIKRTFNRKQKELLRSLGANE